MLYFVLKCKLLWDIWIHIWNLWNLSFRYILNCQEILIGKWISLWFKLLKLLFHYTECKGCIKLFVQYPLAKKSMHVTCVTPAILAIRFEWVHWSLLSKWGWTIFPEVILDNPAVGTSRRATVFSFRTLAHHFILEIRMRYALLCEQ